MNADLVMCLSHVHHGLDSFLNSTFSFSSLCNEIKRAFALLAYIVCVQAMNVRRERGKNKTKETKKERNILFTIACHTTLSV